MKSEIHMEFVNLRFSIEYEGTRYLGWQRLGEKQREKTIQGKIEQVLARLFALNPEEVSVIASGRTDAGVHAKEQIANVHLPSGKSPQEIEEYCNQYLPEDIRIFHAHFVEELFHSRFHAKTKEYHYEISLQKPSVFHRNVTWYCPMQLDIEKMKEARQYFLGEHDFIAFSSLKKTKKSTIRRIDRIEIQETESGLLFRFVGNGFLQNMIRILVGTLIEVGEGKKTKEDIISIFQSKTRQKAGFLAPAKGLTLYKVYY